MYIIKTTFIAYTEFYYESTHFLYIYIYLYHLTEFIEFIY